MTPEDRILTRKLLSELHDTPEAAAGMAVMDRYSVQDLERVHDALMEMMADQIFESMFGRERNLLGQLALSVVHDIVCDYLQQRKKTKNQVMAEKAHQN